MLADGGGLFFEINEALGPQMRQMLKGMYFATDIRKDYLGKARMAVCQKE